MSTKMRKKSRLQAPTQGDGNILQSRNLPTSASAVARANKERPQAKAQPKRNLRPWIVAGIGVLGLIVVLLFLLGVFKDDAKPIPNSPEGRILFLRSMPDGARNLFAVNPDGQGQVQVTRDLIIEGSWSWSPDGRRIAAQVGEKGQSEVAVITLGPDG